MRNAILALLHNLEVDVDRCIRGRLDQLPRVYICNRLEKPPYHIQPKQLFLANFLDLVSI